MMWRLLDGRRVKIVMSPDGKEGYVARWSQACTGCTEVPECTRSPERGVGCHECGYTGRRRRAEWMPFDEERRDWFRGDWFQTFSGRAIWPHSPLAADIFLEDIAHALSHVCRFGGHVRKFYSVAQHSVLVSRIVPPEDALWGLLHDATEAYVGDMIRPLKLALPAYKKIEKDFERVIAERFNLSLPMPASVKVADNVLLLTERRDLLKPSMFPWPEEATKPLRQKIKPWSSTFARNAFLFRYNEIRGAL